jgi:N-sulfoglucosamine sulfohydrolase
MKSINRWILRIEELTLRTQFILGIPRLSLATKEIHQSTRSVLEKCFVFVSAIVAIILLTSSAYLEADEIARPNFLIMIADDLCWRDLGFQGHPDVKTPNLDRLASEGMRLERMFNPAATCSPTRNAIYTGLHCVRSGAFPNHTRVYDGTKTVFTHLKELGYRVALQNKSHVGPAKSYPYEAISGADDFIQTRQFMARDSKQPWMLSFCSNDPHSPWSRRVGEPLDPSRITVPPYMHDNLTTRQQLAKYFDEITKFDEQVGNLLKLVDESGQRDNTVVVFLSEQGCSLPYGGKWSLYDTGIRASTIVRWPGKIAPGSKSERLLQYTDIAPTFIEIAGGDPTKIDTGCPDADGNRSFDGKSFLSILQGEDRAIHEHVFAQHTTVGVNGYEQPYPSRMVRDTRYKLIRNLAPENVFTIGGIHKGEPLDSWRKDAQSDAKLQKRVDWLFRRTGAELYDLQNDPFEMNNLANDPQYSTIRAALQSRLDAWMAQQGDRGLETEMLAPTRQGKPDREEVSSGPPAKPKKKKAKASSR